MNKTPPPATSIRIPIGFSVTHVTVANSIQRIADGINELNKVITGHLISHSDTFALYSKLDDLVKKVIEHENTVSATIYLDVYLEFTFSEERNEWKYDLKMMASEKRGYNCVNQVAADLRAEIANTLLTRPAS